MYKQFVKPISYLVETNISLKDVENKVALIGVLPVGATIMMVSLETIQVTTTPSVTLNIGYESDSDFFIANAGVDTKDESQTSSKKTTIKGDQKIIATLSATATDGEVVARVLYFLPSTIATEIN